MTSTHKQPVAYLKVQDGVGEIILNRPDKRNALNLEMWHLLEEMIHECSVNPDISVVLIHGVDKSVFCAGADISEFQTVRSNSYANLKYGAIVQSVVTGLRNLQKPTIAMISGFCVGGGTEIAVACDFRFASNTTRIGITPAKLGFVYDVAETKMVVDLVGPSNAKDILFTARLLDAGEAYRIGLVDRVFSEDELVEETFNYIKLLLKNAPNSIRGAKAIIDGVTSGMAVDDPLLKQIVTDSLDSPQYKEGVQAFLEKRKPNFPKA